MQKKNRWQFFLILTVVLLTLYHTLPTVFYYLKPLKRPIQETEADQMISKIQKRVGDLEKESKDWLLSFCTHLGIHPVSIEKSGQSWVLNLNSTQEAALVQKYLPRAGSLIPFSPAKLFLAGKQGRPNQVIVCRHFQNEIKKDLFSFAKKDSPLYRKVLFDRVKQMAYALAGPSETAEALAHLHPSLIDSFVFQIQSIADLEQVDPKLANRMKSSFTRGHLEKKSASVEDLISLFQSARDELKKKEGFKKKEEQILKIEQYLKTNKALFSSGQNPLSLHTIETLLESSDTLLLNDLNPFFSSLRIDWEKERVFLELHPDLDLAKAKEALINECAKITLFSKELIEISPEGCWVAFHQKPEVSSLLVFDLAKLGSIQSQDLKKSIKESWTATHPDLKNLLVVSSEEFPLLHKEDQALCLVIENETRFPFPEIHTIGLSEVIQKHEPFPHSEETKLLKKEISDLAEILQKEGFFPSGGREVSFQKIDPFGPLFMATREDFLLRGTGAYAFIELLNHEDRILVENQIDTKIHEDLMKWWDNFEAAQVSLRPDAKFEVPKPTKGLFWNNFLLSWKKYFRGDSKRVIQWGLDLSGGKTVQLELRDANQNPVTDEQELKQGISELYSRVNKMGVSEVSIRQLGHHIVLDFPGSQSLKAKDLIQASSMYFHIVNETFSSPSSPLYSTAQRFLQEVWNEAIVTHQKDTASINAIAHKRLYAKVPSEAARVLLENGLQIAPQEAKISTSLDTSLSKIALIREEQESRESLPLVILFFHHALEGSQLHSIQSGYDPQKGNYLSFSVNSSRDRDDLNPRSVLHQWTSRFSKERMTGSELENITQGRGWRMAALLNDSVISMPTLESALREGGSISGSFSQNEITHLVSDLKAGSLSFTPHILSEKNVSPELGLKDRVQGIGATIAALLLVLCSMILYYRFAGWIASMAVFLNLLILWAVLQNIHATLSLAGIAGIILTVGMAVDANVLVFERIKEEFALTQHIGQAIRAGYKKAYSAILDSNITTIIAALILLNFDAGPIKGFALTLIIGIASSMFTALFVTRFYFHYWLQNPKHKALHMANWIQASSFDFLKKAKFSFVLALFIISLGGFFVFSERATIFGMDFTGGYSTEIELQVREDGKYRPLVEKAFCDHGLSLKDFQIRELSPSHHLRLLFAPSMMQPGKPFFDMPLVYEKGENAQIGWIHQTLESEKIGLSNQSLFLAEKSWTAISGQMSKTMKTNALLGLLISLVCIFIYIAFRFQSKFATAAIFCVVHDVLATLGVLGVLHALKVPVQIDLHTVAAIMTIVGYSLNDTIIIFDRIREELLAQPKQSLYSTINRSLNATLSRTTITSGTTLLVLIALVALGGPSIFSFALVMTIGVILGTLSSWFIASPLFLWLHQRDAVLIPAAAESPPKDKS